MNEGEGAGGTDEKAGDERLLALLHELIGTGGRQETAELLGVSARTLSRALASGRLTARMRDALELHLLSESRESASRQGADTAELARQFRGLEERVDALAAELHGADRPFPGSGSAAPTVPMEQPAATGSRRAYPQLVTLEPEVGEELVYGEATPLIAEWRRVRVEHVEGKDRVTRATAWQRMRELELALIGEHELTLPPAAYPWDRFDRRDELRRRQQSLADARAERRRAVFWRWVRRVLTIGLWRK